jgi:hypothetical protein
MPLRQAAPRCETLFRSWNAGAKARRACFSNRCRPCGSFPSSDPYDRTPWHSLALPPFCRWVVHWHASALSHPLAHSCLMLTCPKVRGAARPPAKVSNKKNRSACAFHRSSSLMIWSSQDPATPHRLDFCSLRPGISVQGFSSFSLCQTNSQKSCSCRNIVFARADHALLKLNPISAFLRILRFRSTVHANRQE